MDNWAADAYELIVFHSGALDEASQHLLQARESSTTANLRIRPVDVDPEVDVESGTEVGVASALDESTKAIWDAQQNRQLPWAVLRMPLHPYDPSQNPPVWSGPFNEATLQAVCDSPVRKRVAKLALEGNAGVWVFLDSGDPAKDDPAFKVLQEQLEQVPRYLSEVALQLNPLLEEHPGEYAFGMLRLTRDDPAEAVLVQMLLNTEPDLPELEEPMAFPVYGRGRALYALVGAGINEPNIREACAFLVGGCSCLVKDQNPGTDLLMAVDWDAELQGAPVKEVEVAPLPSPEIIAAAEAQEAAVEEVAQTGVGGSVLIGLGVAFALVVVLTIAVAVRKRRQLDEA
jgi:hypothetical protein